VGKSKGGEGEKLYIEVDCYRRAEELAEEERGKKAGRVGRKRGVDKGENYMYNTKGNTGILR